MGSLGNEEQVSQLPVSRKLAAHGRWRSDMGRERAQKLPDAHPGEYLL